MRLLEQGKRGSDGGSYHTPSIDFHSTRCLQHNRAAATVLKMAVLGPSRGELLKNVSACAWSRSNRASKSVQGMVVSYVMQPTVCVHSQVCKYIVRQAPASPVFSYLVIGLHISCLKPQVRQVEHYLLMKKKRLSSRDNDLLIRTEIEEIVG